MKGTPEPADSMGVDKIARDNVRLDAFINEQIPEGDRKALEEFLMTGQAEIISSDGRRFIFRISEREEMRDTKGYTIDAFICDDAGELRNIGFFAYTIYEAAARSYINVDRNHMEISSSWYVEREFSNHYEGIGSTLLLFGLYHAAFKNAPAFIVYAPNAHARDILKGKFHFVIAEKDMHEDGALKAMFPLDLSRKPFINLNLPHLDITAVTDADERKPVAGTISGSTERSWFNRPYSQRFLAMQPTLPGIMKPNRVSAETGLENIFRVINIYYNDTLSGCLQVIVSNFAYIDERLMERILPGLIHLRDGIVKTERQEHLNLDGHTVNTSGEQIILDFLALRIEHLRLIDEAVSSLAASGVTDELVFDYLRWFRAMVTESFDDVQRRLDNWKLRRTIRHDLAGVATPLYGLFSLIEGGDIQPDTAKIVSTLTQKNKRIFEILDSTAEDADCLRLLQEAMRDFNQYADEKIVATLCVALAVYPDALEDFRGSIEAMKLLCVGFMEDEEDKRINLNRLFLAAKALRTADPKKCSISIVIGNGADSIYARPGKVFRIFLNLLRNAIQAFPRGVGSIEVKTRLEGNFIAISIRDNGEGMPSDKVLAFNAGRPVSSTKGEGHGQGLNIIRDLVAKNGGTIKVTSELGKGTTFTIKLPIAQGTRLGPASNFATKAPRSGL